MTTATRHTVHHWMIDAPDRAHDGVVDAHCKAEDCSAQRTYPAYAVETFDAYARKYGARLSPPRPDEGFTW